MPIYEFYCDDCNTIFNFFSKSINTTKKPKCPKCEIRTLSRQMSAFAVTGRAKSDEDTQAIPFDEGKMDKAMQMLAGEAEKIDDNDPRQAADLMRKLTDMTGLEMGEEMHEALRRMENGEDPEQVEADLGDLLDADDPFLLSGKKAKGHGKTRPAPVRDETLYDL